jgi:catechol 2,3-dioxygenase-like lactoylglutathione lyase family enzyme
MAIVGLAHTAVCVPDVAAAVDWYTTVLGLRVLSPPYRMEGEAITRDMGELLPHRPVAVVAAIVGTHSGDHVLELIEYPDQPHPEAALRRVHHPGITHVGLVCEDIDATRADLEAGGAVFLVEGAAAVAGLRTTWFRDPWGVTFILMEKGDTGRPYWRQH